MGIENTGQQAPSQLPGEVQPEAGGRGLSAEEARERLEKYGRNQLPEAPLPGLHVIFLRQFLGPFIYILLVAAVVSWALTRWPTRSSSWPCCC